jgi:hypothetical protein
MAGKGDSDLVSGREYGFGELEIAAVGEEAALSALDDVFTLVDREIVFLRLPEYCAEKTIKVAVNTLLSRFLSPDSNPLVTEAGGSWVIGEEPISCPIDSHAPSSVPVAAPRPKMPEVEITPPATPGGEGVPGSSKGRRWKHNITVTKRTHAGGSGVAGATLSSHPVVKMDETEDLNAREALRRHEFETFLRAQERKKNSSSSEIAPKENESKEVKTFKPAGGATVQRVVPEKLPPIVVDTEPVSISNVKSKKRKRNAGGERKYSSLSPLAEAGEEGSASVPLSAQIGLQESVHFNQKLDWPHQPSLTQTISLSAGVSVTQGGQSKKGKGRFEMRCDALR